MKPNPAATDCLTNPRRDDGGDVSGVFMGKGMGRMDQGKCDARLPVVAMSLEGLIRLILLSHSRVKGCETVRLLPLPPCRLGLCDL